MGTAGRSLSRPPAVLLLSGLLLAALASSAVAHEEKQVGKVSLSIGWLHEPAYAGIPNAVEVTVTQGGRPAKGVELEATVIFGEEDAAIRTDPLPLDAAADDPAGYQAFLIPTRPGDYTFEITGTVGKKRIDETITSGERTFDEVVTPAEAQFPEQDPTQGEIAERLERIDARIADLRSALGSEESDGPSSLLPWAALALAALALAVALVRRRERHAAT
jgi:MYXO-CTERM domain-containing protein